MKNETSRTVFEIVSGELKLPLDQVSESLSIGDIPQWGSMAQMAIIIALQNKFEVKIPVDDLFDLTSVGDLISEIEKLQNA